MNDNHHIDRNKNKKMNIAAAGAIGLLIGAAGTAALMLSDREMRKRATKKAGEISQNMGKWSNEAIKNLKTNTDEVKQNAINKISEVKDKTKEAEETAKEKASRTIH